jgi:hypothetical protein
MKPFDVIGFRGADFVGRGLRQLQRLELGSAADVSHVGLYVDSTVLHSDKVLPGRRYILESTCSGPLADGVKNIYGESFLGVQIRDLDLVLQHCTGQAFYCPMKKSWRDAYYTADQVPHYNNVVWGVVGTRYDANPVSLVSSLFPALRCLRRLAERGTQQWLFCSEMAAWVLKECGLLPPSVNAKNVVPSDFLLDVTDSDADMPKIYERPILLLAQAQSSPAE